MTETFADPDRLGYLFAEGWGSQLLLQSLPDSILVIQPDGTVAYASVNAGTLFGCSISDLVGRPFESLVAEDDRSVFPSPPYSGLVGAWDFRAGRAPGRWLNATFHTPTPDTDGESLHSLIGDAVVMLVRDNDRSNVDIRDRLDLYRRTIDAMDNLIVVTNPMVEDNPVVLANEEFLRFTGYTRAEVVGQNWRFLQTRPDGTHDDEQEGVRELARAVAEGESTSVLLRNYKKDGELFYNELFVTPVRGADGCVVNYIGVQNDVTPRIQANSEAVNRERLLRHAVKETSSGVFIMGASGPDYAIVYANPAFTTITGYSADDGVGQPAWFWWGDGPDPARRDQFFQTVFGGQASHVIARCERKDGERYWAEVKASPVRVEGHEDRGIVGAITDVTARIEAEHAERHHRDELRALSARLVKIQEDERMELSRELHDEIGQALTSLLLSLDAAAQMPDRTPAILSSARDIVRDLQDSVRNLSLDLRPAMLNDLGLGPALEWLFERVQERMHLRVYPHLAQPFPPFPPDTATAAYRIVQEALTNVAKHAGTKDVSVQVSVEDGHLGLTVVDGGKGMDPERTQNATSGLQGMAERARRLGGSLSVVSHKGNGTTISAYIPLTSHSAA